MFSCVIGFALVSCVMGYAHPYQSAGAITRNEGNERLATVTLTHEREVANRLLHRLMDVAFETFKDLGASKEDLEDIKQKRGRITQCYFQAVSCY